MNSFFSLFNIPTDTTYLNAAYMSPQLRELTSIGQESLARKEKPWSLSANDFFDPTNEVRILFSNLVNCRMPEQVALTPSVSYAMANVAKNLSGKSKKSILLLEEQFPSNYYPWERLAAQEGYNIEIVKAPVTGFSRGEEWSDRIMEMLKDDVLAICLPHVHWSDGTVFRLKDICRRAREHDIFVIVDGTQSVGAMPLDLEHTPVDALVVAGYKWLMGPYGMGFSYYSERFNDGIPIEESWVNRENSDNFQQLVNYQDSYRPGARRYEVGEASMLGILPMSAAAIRKLIEWQPANIQSHCLNISTGFCKAIQSLGWGVDMKYRAGHLFGIRPPQHFDIDRFKFICAQERVYVSYRGSAIRISPHLYNSLSDFDRLLDIIRLVQQD